MIAAPDGSTTAGTPACSCRSSRFRRGGAGGSARFPISCRCRAWLDGAGLDFVQFLPVNEMEDGQSSPYSALSAMAIDPIFIAVEDVDEFVVAGDDVLGRRGSRGARARARSPPRVDYAVVRALKCRALRRGVRVVRGQPLGHRRSARPVAARLRGARALVARRLRAVPRAARRARRAATGASGNAGLRDRDPAALAAARERLEWQIRYYAYLQWIADEQWQRARMEAAPVGIFGDFPFMVSGHSADVWARQHEFDLDSSVGTPPGCVLGDRSGLGAAGLPLGRRGGQRLRVAARAHPAIGGALRRLSRRSPHRFLSHVRAPSRTAARGFVPADEPAQRAQGERLAVGLQRGRRQPDRRGPRHRSGLSARVARRAWACRG